MILPAVQPLELFVGDLLHGGSVVVLCFYLVYSSLLAMFYMVVACSCCVFTCWQYATG